MLRRNSDLLRIFLLLESAGLCCWWISSEISSKFHTVIQFSLSFHPELDLFLFRTHALEPMGLLMDTDFDKRRAFATNCSAFEIILFVCLRQLLQLAGPPKEF